MAGQFLGGMPPNDHYGGSLVCERDRKQMKFKSGGKKVQHLELGCGGGIRRAIPIVFPKMGPSISMSVLEDY